MSHNLNLSGTNLDGAGVPRLGLVCITHSDEVRYRALTRKRLLQLDAQGQKQKLRELYAGNLARQGLVFYLVTCHLSPFTAWRKYADER